MEPIRLWRIYCDGWNYTDDEEVSKIGEPLVALPRAEYDALVAKCDLFDEINAERTDLLRAKFLRPDFNAINALDAATARAEKAEARIASIERVASEQYAALRGRAERAEALLAKTIPCVKFYNENQSPPGLELNLLDEIEKLIKETT